MFGRKRKHINVLLHRHGADVYQDGRYLHIDVKLSIKSQRERNTLRDVLNAIYDVVALEENPIKPFAISGHGSPPSDLTDRKIMGDLDTMSEQIQESEKS